MLDKTPNHASAPLHTGPHTYTDAYHLRLGASATRYRDRENISQQIAPPTNATTALTRFKDAGAIIAQFVTAARTMAEAENYQGSDARQVRLDAATKAGDHIAIGGQKLKNSTKTPKMTCRYFLTPWQSSPSSGRKCRAIRIVSRKRFLLPLQAHYKNKPRHTFFFSTADSRVR